MQLGYKDTFSSLSPHRIEHVSFLFKSAQNIQLSAAELFAELFLQIMCQVRENCICYLPMSMQKRLKVKENEF
jgi:hypothetical protein